MRPLRHRKPALEGGGPSGTRGKRDHLNAPSVYHPLMFLSIAVSPWNAAFARKIFEAAQSVPLRARKGT
jgi:hypothetical protein